MNATIKTAALDTIETIREEIACQYEDEAELLQAIADALCDGEVLGSMGLTEEAAQAAYDEVEARLAAL